MVRMNMMMVKAAAVNSISKIADLFLRKDNASGVVG
jgi:hypothetical protein